jgi:hypothetical protein
MALPPRRPRRPPGQERGQLNVLHRGQLVHQVEGLEDEARHTAPQPGQPSFSHLIHTVPRKQHRSIRRTVQPAQQVQQRRLSAAAGTRDRHGLPGHDIQVDARDRVREPSSLAVVLAQRPGADR